MCSNWIVWNIEWFLPHNNFPLVQPFGYSAQYFHQVYRHVFQLTCVLHLEPNSAWGYLSFGKMWCDTFITESWSSKQISMPEVFNRNGNVLPSNIKYASIPQWVARLYYRVQTANPVNHTCWVIHHILNWGLVSHARGLWYSILVLLSTLRTIAPPFCCIYFLFATDIAICNHKP